MLFGNGWLRQRGGDLAKENPLASIAEQFGKAVSDKPYLRSALNDSKISDFASSADPHQVSQVLTGAIFDILINLAKQYVEVRERTTLKAFWDVAARMQRTVVQLLDLLPPVDVTFRDYALAVIRAEQPSNPKVI